jgi:multidrug resistance efflux pump
MTNPIAPVHHPAASRLLPRSYVAANFMEIQLRRMRPGRHAEVSPDPYSDHPLVGKVEPASAR